jgi:hypothetical protein
MMIKFIKSPTVIHPYLISSLSITYLLPYVIVFNIPFYSIIFLLCLVILVVNTSFKIINYLINNNIKSGLITTILLTPIISYGILTNYLIYLTNKNKLVIILILATWLITIPYIVISSKQFVRLNLFLNLLSLSLCFLYVVIAVRNIVDFDSIRIHEDREASKDEQKLDTSSDKMRPDIYYIILDAHTGFEGLQKYWNFDNHDFHEYLKGKGFLIPPKGMGNYHNTLPSMSSSLNMNYIDNYLKFEKMTEILRCFKAEKFISNSNVASLLKSYGYEIINLSPFRVNNAAQYYQFFSFSYDKDNIYSLFFKGTIVALLAKKLSLCNNFGLTLAGTENVNNDIVSQLKQIPMRQHNKPKFVYAHLLMPHPPCIYDAKGNKYSDSLTQIVDKDKERYVEYLIYTDSLMQRVIDKILEASPQSIVILQGDHGSRMLNSKQEEGNVLNAYYLPNCDAKLFYDNISPVNTFRLIFNTYFGKHYDFLIDKDIGLQ